MAHLSRIKCPPLTCTAVAISAAYPIVCGASCVIINLPVFITDCKEIKVILSCPSEEMFFIYKCLTKIETIFSV